MPTYQYACTECGDRSEVVQRFTDDPLTVCTACAGRLRKVFSPVGIVFKGSGFYRTDSRNGSSTAPAGKDGAAASGSNGPSESSGSSNGDGSKSDGSKSDGSKSGSSVSGSDAGSSKSSSSTASEKKGEKKSAAVASSTSS